MGQIFSSFVDFVDLYAWRSTPDRNYKKTDGAPYSHNEEKGNIRLLILLDLFKTLPTHNMDRDLELLHFLRQITAKLKQYHLVAAKGMVNSI